MVSRGHTKTREYGNGLKVDLIANKKFRHAGKTLEIGDPFTAHPTIGKAYKLTGYASEAEAGIVETDDYVDSEPGEYETRVMVPGEPIKRKRGRPRKDASI